MHEATIAPAPAAFASRGSDGACAPARRECRCARRAIRRAPRRGAFAQRRACTRLRVAQRGPRRVAPVAIFETVTVFCASPARLRSAQDDGFAAAMIGRLGEDKRAAYVGRSTACRGQGPRRPRRRRRILPCRDGQIGQRQQWLVSSSRVLCPGGALPRGRRAARVVAGAAAAAPARRISARRRRRRRLLGLLPRCPRASRASRSRNTLPRTAERDRPPKRTPMACAVSPLAQSCFSSAICSSVQASPRIRLLPQYPPAPAVSSLFMTIVTIFVTVKSLILDARSFAPKW